jgi:2-dehydro-3-deoxyphosphooctonate aldolase (KDO 8-P synthase)
MCHGVKIDNHFTISGKKLTLIGGPCSIENEETCIEVAEKVKRICSRLGINYIFKSSFDKANRSSLNSGRAVGMERGLRILENIKNTFNIPVTTDVHESWQCKDAGAVADIIQIPAYLCRQTDLLLAAAKTGRAVSVKKGQFLAPWDMENVVNKIKSVNNDKIIIIERGSFFGYNRLVVDMTGLAVMRRYNCPVFMDATHAVQEPGGMGTSTGGNREFAPLLMYAALAARVDGIFAEIHPEPDKAVSDASSQIHLRDIEEILEKAVKYHNVTWEEDNNGSQRL